MEDLDAADARALVPAVYRLTMRVVILTNRQGNQKALACKIAEKAEVAAIVVSKNIPRRRPGTSKRLRLFINSIAGRTVGREFVDAWIALLGRYESRLADFPRSHIVEADNVNDDATVRTIEEFSPDLVVVSGTNLVGKAVINAAARTGGIVNLHTGISPYVKGGPNCTNWCLAKGWFHLIGSTVMWLDLGIDTGNIIATEKTELDGKESLADLHFKVMEHAHRMYVDTIERIGRGVALPSIPQSNIGDGTHFGSVDWNAAAMRTALINFRKGYRTYFEEGGSPPPELKLYPLTDD